VPTGPEDGKLETVPFKNLSKNPLMLEDCDSIQVVFGMHNRVFGCVVSDAATSSRAFPGSLGFRRQVRMDLQILALDSDSFQEQTPEPVS